MAFSSGQIVKTGGRKKNRFGISLPDLPPFLRKFLLENNQLREIEEERHLQILFKMREREFRRNHNDRIYICPHTGEPATLKQIEKNADRVSFSCFHCGTQIFSVYNDFTMQNLSCGHCEPKEHTAQDFINYTEEFRIHVKSHLSDERKNLIKYIKKNSKY